jgi:abortive infection bacteriophage resistance protein
MAQYTKPWLSVEQQLDRLAARGVELGDRERATALLRAVGYYRLTGYLYPFRRSQPYEDEAGASGEGTVRAERA